LETHPRRAAILGQSHLEAPGGALVALQDAADLPVHLFPVETLF